MNDVNQLEKREAIANLIGNRPLTLRQANILINEKLVDRSDFDFISSNAWIMRANFDTQRFELLLTTEFDPNTEFIFGDDNKQDQ